MPQDGDGALVFSPLSDVPRECRWQSGIGLLFLLPVLWNVPRTMLQVRGRKEAPAGTHGVKMWRVSRFGLVPGTRRSKQGQVEGQCLRRFRREKLAKE